MAEHEIDELEQQIIDQDDGAWRRPGRGPGRWLLYIVIWIGAVWAVVWAVDSVRGPSVERRRGYRPGSTIVSLDSPEMLTLGKVEGPFLFVRANGPARAMLGYLGDAGASPLTIELIGLGQGEMTPPEEDPAADESPEAAAGESDTTDAQPAGDPTRDIAAARKLMTDALAETCQEGRLWFLPMAAPGPNQSAQGYLLRLVEGEAGSGDRLPASGRVELLNARLLRDGKALMPAALQPHPFLQRMIDSQVAAMVEAESGRARGTLWDQYKLRTPDDEFFVRTLEESRRAAGVKSDGLRQSSSSKR